MYIDCLQLAESKGLKIVHGGIRTLNLRDYLITIGHTTYS